MPAPRGLSIILVLAVALAAGCATHQKTTSPEPKTAEAPRACRKPEARRECALGIKLQRGGDAAAAIAAFGKGLASEPDCPVCLYQLGWSYWSLDDWDRTIATWEKLLSVSPRHRRAREYLAVAKARKLEAAQHARSHGVEHVSIGVSSLPAAAPVHLKLVARFQSYDKSPRDKADHYDPEIDSPKSARFDSSGAKIYVNSLEARKTLVYATDRLEKTSTIRHSFDRAHASLFREPPPFGYAFTKARRQRANMFTGLPVESELSHGGRYLWVPYYRRNFDSFGTDPSAVAVIDTKTDRIVRVMATGPVAKYAKASPDGKYMVISHWGDNTLSLIDISSPHPREFKHVAHLIVENRLPADALEGVNRDHECGFCLRGLVYSADSRYLFVARMGGPGGVAVFDLKAKGGPSYLGAFSGMHQKPRDLAITSAGDWLYLSATMTGFLSRVKVASVLEALARSGRAVAAAPSEDDADSDADDDEDDGGDAPRPRPSMTHITGFEETYVGTGPRSIRLSPDERFVFVALYGSGEVAVVDTRRMKVVSRIKADPSPVGAALSPDGRQLWVTAQSKRGRGGNSVMVFAVEYADND